MDSRVVMVTTDREAVAEGLTAADAALRDLGCAPASPRGGLDRVRDEYWTVDNPQVARYGAAGLPGATYTCAGGVSMLVQPTSDREASTEPDDRPRPPRSSTTTISRSWYTAEDLTTLSRESGAALALVVTAERTYYRTRF